MKTVAIPWGAWYENDLFELQFPDDWNVETATMKDAQEISESDIQKAFSRPIGTPPIAEMAKGNRTAAIAVDDLTRPTEAFRFLPYVIEELHAAGINDDAITVIIALGSHRPLTRQDLIKKLGKFIVDRYRVYNHCPFDDLVPVGTSSNGSPILVNRLFMEAEFKIAVGFVVPHPTAGWGGGGKIIMPGVCGIETLAAVHGADQARGGGPLAIIEGNKLREEIDDIAARAGLNVIVNAVGTSRGGTAGLFVGHYIEAHRAGVDMARRVYATDVPLNIDVGVFNSYPEDTEFLQCGKALNVWSDPDHDLVNRGGTIIVTTAASEGRGTHYLGDVGMRLFRKAEEHPALAKKMSGRQLIFFSPTVTSAEVTDRYSENTLFFNRWEPLLEELSKRHGSGTHAVVFPCCCLQYFQV
jgi:nickel-dependent lactate racemase